MINEGKFIGEAIDYDSIDRYQINIIRANCGAGKTTAALETIPERLGFKPSSGLFLTPLNSLREELIYAKRAKPLSLEELRRQKESREAVLETNNNYDEEEIKDCITEEDLTKLGAQFTIMTYASFGVAIRERLINYNDYDCIICDEIHALLKPLGMDRAKFKKLHPDSTDLMIAEMMKVGSNTYAAINAISLAAILEETWVFGLTATPEPLEKINAFKGIMKEVEMLTAIQMYDTLRIFGYKSIEDIFTKPIPIDTKRLFYFPLVSQEKDAVEAIEETKRKAIALWSLSHKEKMNEEQLNARDYLIKTGYFPENVQDLIINSSYDLGLNIKDPQVKEVYVHTGDPVTREQVRGRIRHDIEEFGYYDKGESKKEIEGQKAAKRREEEMTEIELLLYNNYNIIKNYMDRSLLKEDKTQMIEELGINKGWTTIKAALINIGYIIEDKQVRLNGKNPRVSIITRK